MSREVDLFVIGAGSGGVRAARIAAGYGAQVMIAEEYRVGGTCVIRGCVPKKLLVHAARFADDFEDAEGFGWSVPKPTFDWPALIRNKDREIARLEAAYIANLERSKVEIVKSRAVIEDGNSVRLLTTGELIRAKTILIATGGTPHAGAAIAGLEHVISSNEAFDLKQLPKRILIQGGGYIAVEFAGIFNGLGSQVTLVYRGNNILRGFDDEVREHLRGEMERRGIKIVTRQTVTGVEKVDHGLSVDLSDHESFTVDTVMFATGRKPQIAGLGLDAAGIQIGANGGIAVDAQSRTSSPDVYAIGDVTNRINLTPVAIREGHAFADRVFGAKPARVDYDHVPTAVFSTPEIGTIGVTESEACTKFARVDVYKTMFRTTKSALAGRDTRTFMKLLVDADSDRVIGCHIVGPEAGEMIQLVGIAVRMNATKADFDATMAVHPTAAEELVTMRTKATTHIRQPAAAE